MAGRQKDRKNTPGPRCMKHALREKLSPLGRVSQSGKAQHGPLMILRLRPAFSAAGVRSAEAILSLHRHTGLSLSAAKTCVETILLLGNATPSAPTVDLRPLIQELAAAGVVVDPDYSPPGFKGRPPFEAGPCQPL